MSYIIQSDARRVNDVIHSVLLVLLLMMAERGAARLPDVQ